MPGLQLNMSFDDTRSVFVALTIVVILIVLVSNPRLVTTLVILGLLFALWGLLRRSGSSEGFAVDFANEVPAYSRGAGSAPPAVPMAVSVPAPGSPAPYVPQLVAAPHPAHNRADSARLARYPGAVDADEFDSETDHRDRTEGDARLAPDGNPFNLSRIANEVAAAPCDDDEANDEELDGDERMANQGTARNDATRVTAGTMNRRRTLDKYFRENLDEDENSRWWGRHEY